MTGPDYEHQLSELAEEFRVTPPYVVLTSETDLGEFQVPAGRLWGMHGPMLDMTLREQLGDRWTGRRPALLADDEQIRRNIGDIPGIADIAEELIRERVDSVVVHEAVHALEQEFFLEDVSQLLVMDAKFATVKHLAASPESIAAGREPWAGHLAQFVRLALHLTHRAEQRGWHVVKPLVFRGQSYGLSDIHVYASMLGDEPEQMANESFATIRETPMPGEFLSLWRKDIGKWYTAKFNRPAAA